MKMGAKRFLIFLCFTILTKAFTQKKLSDHPLPNAAQLSWQKAELGAVFHYDLHVFDKKKYRQTGISGNRINPIPDYQIFNPEQLDTDQWIKSIKKAGFKFAIITATHETGFALYPSNVNPYNVKALKWKDGKGDIVGDFINSCKKYGILPGIYVGIRWNSFFGVHDFKVNGTGEFQKKRQLYYNQMVEGMVKELCTQYGPLFEIWFDGGASHPDLGAPDVLPIVKKYQPDCLFYHNNQLAEARWGGSESGTVPYPCWSTFPTPYSHTGDTTTDHINLLKHGDPEGKYWMPAMSDAPLRGYNGRHEWFWEPGDEEHIFPLEELMHMYYNSVGHNSTLIMGLTPDPRGLLPEADVKRLEEWGEAIEKTFSKPIATTAVKGKEVALALNGSKIIQNIVIQEDISQGQRIRKYNIHGFTNGRWRVIAEGQSVGHKRIHRLEPIAVEQLRLEIQESSLPPIVSFFGVY